MTVSGLEAHVLPDPVLRRIEAETGLFNDRTWVMLVYLLRPLRDFGLIEFRPPVPDFATPQDVPITDLWKKFFAFRYQLNYALLPKPGLN